MLRPYLKPVTMALAGSLDARLDRRRRLPHPIVAQLLVLDARHLDVDINAIQQWTRDALLIFRDRACGASAAFTESLK